MAFGDLLEITSQGLGNDSKVPFDFFYLFAFHCL